MREALAEARRGGGARRRAGRARSSSCDGAIVGRGGNRRESDGDPTAHAEMLALREAARAVGGWRLVGATLYVTQEPCPMCAGAIVNARVERVVFGCDNPKAGAVQTLYQLLEDPRLNHRVTSCERSSLAERVRRAAHEVLRRVCDVSIIMERWQSRSIAPDSKSGVPARVPGVRIPPSPPCPLCPGPHRDRHGALVIQDGEMTEWPKVHDWKSCVPKGTEGSNPSLSATISC